MLEGKGFTRARMGGVTRAVTAPLSVGGLVRGVSAGFLTSGKRTLLDGGIFRDIVGLHFDLGPLSKVSHGAVSFAVKELRELVGLDARGQEKDGAHEIPFAAALKGLLPPFVVHAKSAVRKSLSMTSRKASSIRKESADKEFSMKSNRLSLSSEILHVRGITRTSSLSFTADTKHTLYVPR